VFGRGNAEQRVFVRTGRTERGYDLSPAVPNTPDKRPADTLVVEEWANVKLAEPTVIKHGDLFPIVISPKNRTIRFGRPRTKIG
jgi:hypothetical protein